MGYCVLWITSLAAALFLVALGLALGSKLRRRFWLVGAPALALVPSLVLGVLASIVAGMLRWHKGIVKNSWFSYSLSWTLLLVAGAALLIVFGLSKRTGENDSPRARTWPQGKLGVAFVVLCVLCVGALLHMNSATRARLVKARVDARALALSLDYPHVSDRENAALVYESAFEAVGDVQSWLQERSINMDKPYADATSKEVEEYLKENQPVLKLLRGAAAMPGFRVEWDCTRPFCMRILSVRGCRNAASLLALDARNRAAKGDAGRAVEDITAIRGMAVHVSRQPVLMCVTTAASIDCSALRALE